MCIILLIKQLSLVIVFTKQPGASKRLQSVNLDVKIRSNIQSYYLGCVLDMYIKIIVR